MYHYDPNTALEELTEDATLPNPVHVRDMILRKHLSADKSLELNRMFVEYQKFFGETQKLGKEILKQLTGPSSEWRWYTVGRRHLPARKSISSSRVNPASLNNDISVPFGRSRL